MKIYRFDMWQGAKKVLLVDVLNRLSTAESVDWALLDFHGTGSAPNGKGILEFEDEIRHSTDGYSFEQAALERFAHGLSDLYDIRVVGSINGCRLIDLEAIDSGLWEVSVDGKIASFTRDGLQCALQRQPDNGELGQRDKSD